MFGQDFGFRVLPLLRRFIPSPFSRGHPDGMGQTVDASIAESVFGMLEVPRVGRKGFFVPRCVNFHPFFQRNSLPKLGEKKNKNVRERNQVFYF